MSTLVASLADVQDAHEDLDQDEIYYEKIKELSETTDGFPWKFEVIDGFFKQSDPETDDTTFNYAEQNMGRIKPWETVIADLESLNAKASPYESYKLIFLARHGQGYHNVIIDKYGYDEWHRKWYRLTHDGDIVYGPDPMLTPLGIQQAKENNRLWKAQVEAGAPVPSKFYVSPLQRASHTMVYTFDGIKAPDQKPVVTELIRETNGTNVCDKRSPKSVIVERFGQHGFVFEDGFTEQDQLYDDNVREKLWQHTIRINRFLQRLFDEDFDAASGSVDRSLAHKHTFISTTSHAGSIRCFITALGHRKFTISTGGMIPVVVRGYRAE